MAGIDLTAKFDFTSPAVPQAVSASSRNTDVATNTSAPFDEFLVSSLKDAAPPVAGNPVAAGASNDNASSSSVVASPGANAGNTNRADITTLTNGSGTERQSPIVQRDDSGSPLPLDNSISQATSPTNQVASRVAPQSSKPASESTKDSSSAKLAEGARVDGAPVDGTPVQGSPPAELVAALTAAVAPPGQTVPQIAGSQAKALLPNAVATSSTVSYAGVSAPPASLVDSLAHQSAVTPQAAVSQEPSLTQQSANAPQPVATRPAVAARQPAATPPPTGTVPVPPNTQGLAQQLPQPDASVISKPGQVTAKQRAADSGNVSSAAVQVGQTVAKVDSATTTELQLAPPATAAPSGAAAAKVNSNVSVPQPTSSSDASASSAGPPTSLPLNSASHEISTRAETVPGTAPASSPVAVIQTATAGSAPQVPDSGTKPSVGSQSTADRQPTAAEAASATGKSQNTFNLAAQVPIQAPSDSVLAASAVPSKSARSAASGDGELAAAASAAKQTGDHRALIDIQSSHETSSNVSAATPGAEQPPNASPVAVRQMLDPASVNQAQLLDHVTQAIQVSHQNGHEVRIRLSPPELGSLQIDVSVKNGALSARLETQNSAAQQVLSDNLPQLREALAQQGMTVDRIDVFMAGPQSGEGRPDLADRSFGQNQPQRDPSNSQDQQFVPAESENANPQSATRLTRMRERLTQLDIMV